jgi:hypothetical protein
MPNVEDEAKISLADFDSVTATPPMHGQILFWHIIEHLTAPHSRIQLR